MRINSSWLGLNPPLPLVPIELHTQTRPLGETNALFRQVAPSCAGPALFSLQDPGESFLPAGPAVGSLELLPLLLLLLLLPAAQPGQTSLEQAWAVTSLPFPVCAEEGRRWWGWRKFGRLKSSA